MPIITAQHLAHTILAAVLADPALAACTSFAELHDHIDANTLGDQEAHSGNLELLNEAQDLVTTWLADPRTIPQEIARLYRKVSPTPLHQKTIP